MICGRATLPGSRHPGSQSKGQLLVLDEAAPFLDEKSEFRQTALTACVAIHWTTDYQKYKHCQHGGSVVGGIQPATIPLFCSLNTQMD
jgi:hypothetical protein